MKTIFKAALLATVTIGATVAVPTIAAAQTASGVAVADLDKAVADSAAYAAAIGQIRTTYATQIAAVQARQKVLEDQIKPLVTAFRTAQSAPNANQTALQTQAQSIQQRQQAAQAELQRMSQPFDRARAYAVEQISTRLSAAAKTAMTARNVAVVVPPQATVLFAPAADMTAAITAELNKVVPSVSTAVPATWQPGQQGAGAAAPTPPAPTGR